MRAQRPRIARQPSPSRPRGLQIARGRPHPHPELRCPGADTCRGLGPRPARNRSPGAHRRRRRRARSALVHPARAPRPTPAPRATPGERRRPGTPVRPLPAAEQPRQPARAQPPRAPKQMPAHSGICQPDPRPWPGRGPREGRPSSRSGFLPSTDRFPTPALPGGARSAARR